MERAVKKNNVNLTIKKMSLLNLVLICCLATCCALGFNDCIDVCVTRYYQFAREGYSGALRGYFQECSEKCICLG